jgi:aryl-alcohol dehydrogenase-like predicted oxidoreductase
MESRVLGAAGLRVSRMGLGLAALGRPAYINLGHADDLDREYAVDAMRRRTARVLDAAWDAGVRYVDAARSYGRAEDFLASWLRSRAGEGGRGSAGAARPVIGSKWGYEYTGGWRLDARTHEVKEHSTEMFRRQLAQSRALLGSSLDLYQVHSVTPDSPVLDDDGLLDALAELRASGTAVGVTLSGPGQAAALERALDIRRDGVRLFATVQATWNVLEPSVGPQLAAAHEVGMGVIVKEGLANGRLTSRNADRGLREVVAPIAGRAQVSIDAVALGVVLAQPWADVVLSGAARVDHLVSNLRALDVDLGAADLEALAGLAEDPERYWSRRSALEWA